MYKSIGLILAATILAAATLLIYSCGHTAKQKTITFWHFQCEPAQTKAMEELVAEFEKIHDCKVEMTVLTWKDGKTKLSTAFNSETAPDILELGSDWVTQFAASGVLSELNKDSIGFSRFIDYSTAPSVYKGKYYAVPWTIDTRVMYYNKPLMRQALGTDVPPKSFAELAECARKIGDIPGVYGWGAGGPDRHTLYKRLLYFVRSYGGEVLNSAGKPAINSPQNVKAYEMYIALAQSGMIETQRQLDAAFVQGKLGFWISGGWLLAKLEKENPGLDFGTATVPGCDGKPGISFAGGEYLAVNDKSESKDLAVELIRYITDGARTLEYCKKIPEAGFPADKNYFSDDFYKSHKYRSVFAEQLKYAGMTPIHPKWLEIEAVFEKSMEEALLGKKGVYGALKDAQEDMETIAED